MGFRMEKFGAEEMEVKLFLFTVLQIHLFSPRSTGRGLLRSMWGDGEMEGPGCFTDALATLRFGLTGRPCAGGWEALAEGGAAWPPPVPGSLQLSLLQTHHSLFTRLRLPFS